MSGKVPTKQLGIGTLMVSTEGLITNLSIPNKNVEVSHALQDGVKQIIISSRNRCTLRFALNSGETLTNYKTLYFGTVFCISDIKFVGKSIYLQSDADSTTVEIVEFY